MSKESDLVKNQYSGMVDKEWGRLISDDFHRLEYDTTWRFLDQFLPVTGLVLDAGGGPGRYTIDLARKNYDIILLDLTPNNLERARQEITKDGVSDHVKSIVEGTITDLSRYEANTFDAVLCTGGPLSHVFPRSARQRALAELVRMAKTGAPIFVSVMSKYGVLLATPTGWPEAVIKEKEEFDRILDCGDCYTFVKDGYCHFYTSQELESDFEGLEVKIVQKAGLEGFNVQEPTLAFAANYPEAWQKWQEIHYKMCSDPFVVDASGHMLFVAQKKG